MLKKSIEPNLLLPQDLVIQKYLFLFFIGCSDKPLTTLFTKIGFFLPGINDPKPSTVCFLASTGTTRGILFFKSIKTFNLVRTKLPGINRGLVRRPVDNILPCFQFYLIFKFKYLHL
ncbi:MAG: hypothetical protein DRR04_06570 [Gammaproteobacteria bacterium]|nr:MAG: hypothetical protein DRR04_06570 [Gammaproteobacteria bacterium]